MASGNQGETITRQDLSAFGNSIDVPGTYLHKEARQGKSENIIALTQEGYISPALVNQELEDGSKQTALHIAVYQEDIATISALLQVPGINCNKMDSTGKSLLAIIADNRKSHPELFRVFILEYMYHQAATGHLENFLKAEENAAYRRPNYQVKETGDTLLHVIARHGRMNLLPLLLHHHLISPATLTLPNNQGQIPLHCAIASGHIKSVRALLQYQKRYPHIKTIAWKDKNNQTPDTLAKIYLEATTEHDRMRFEEIRGLLSSYMANTTAQSHPLSATEKGNFPSEAAKFGYISRLIEEGNLKEIQALLEEGMLSKEELAYQDEDGNTLLHKALEFRQPKILRELLSIEEITIWQRNNLGKNIVDLLEEIKVEANPDFAAIYDFLYADCLTEAAANNNLPYLEECLNCMPKDDISILNNQDMHGDTPLHAAAREGKVEIVRWLCAQGVALETENKKGETALDSLFASFYGESYCTDDECRRENFVNSVLAMIEAGASMNTGFGYYDDSGMFRNTSPADHLIALSEEAITSQIEMDAQRYCFLTKSSKGVPLAMAEKAEQARLAFAIAQKRFKSESAQKKLESANRIIYAHIKASYPEIESRKLETDPVKLNKQLWEISNKPKMIKDLPRAQLQTLAIPEGESKIDFVSPRAPFGPLKATPAPHVEKRDPRPSQVFSPAQQSEMYKAVSTMLLVRQASERLLKGVASRKEGAPPPDSESSESLAFGSAVAVDKVGSTPMKIRRLDNKANKAAQSSPSAPRALTPF